MRYNPLLDTDSYKAGHYLQYPPGTEAMFSYIESRGGLHPYVVFFGLQYILKEYLSRRITQQDVDEAAEFYAKHGEPFNQEGWEYIVKHHEGRWPVRIRAVPEGTVIPVKNVLVTVESTDPKCFWVVSFLETMLMRVWYPITVATNSHHCRQVIMKYLEKTSDDPANEINFKLHDFGARGVSSYETSALGGAAHLVNFMGSDTVAGVALANRYYNTEMAAFSIPAAEHSTITAWGKDQEADAYKNMLEKFAKPGGLVAVVSDSYNIWNAVGRIWGQELRESVIQSGATVVIRPDSGNPPEVVTKVLLLLKIAFGVTLNKKGYKVLNHVRVIQGDGMDPEMIEKVLETITNDGYSASNVAFGMGGGLLQNVNRDTQRFAMKCSQVLINGQVREVFKQPITDPGKNSKKGRLDLIKENGEYKTININEFTTQEWPPYIHSSELVTVYENGQIVKEWSLEEVRSRAR